MNGMDGRVSLRPVEAGDLEILFTHQLDPEATRMASFPSRDRRSFFAHWTAHVLGNPAANNRTILVDQRVVGHVGAWTDAASGQRLLCYWLGREFWGRGIASAATRTFLGMEIVRPLFAQVAGHNAGSIRVLEKAGFARFGEDLSAHRDEAADQELVYVLSR
jgi:RimJ/RimL family protein N-acetyltransferase